MQVKSNLRFKIAGAQCFFIFGSNRIELTALLTYTDQELIKLLSEDNREAFEKLYARHWEELFKTAFAILKDRDASKDIVQDIFIWLWQHRYTLRVISLKFYLKAAVKFKVANYIRSGDIRESFFRELSYADLSKPAITIEEELETKQLKGIIQLAISKLPEKCREIFQLSRESHLSNQEIALRLNISIKTVENQMTIAIRRLRQAADPHIATTGALLLFYLYQLS